MNKNLIYLAEPGLIFGYNQVTDDSRDGLALFGPYEKSEGVVRVGVIGTESNIQHYSSFVMEMNKPLLTNSLGRPSFPGFESVFGLKLPMSPTATLTVSAEKIEELSYIKNLNERTYNLVSLYLHAILHFIKNEEKPIDIWYVIVPHMIYLNCRPRSKSGKATVSRQRVEIFQSGQISLFGDDQVSEYVDMYESDTDFHDQLKARALSERIQTPIQIMHENTLQFKGKSSSDKNDESYSDDMKAHLLWTHSSSLYYKLGHLPWKLNNVRPGVCYIGLVFKRLQSTTASGKGYACSAAQMFLDSGDGIIFRGNIGPWLSKNERTYHLDRESARDLIKIAMESYKSNKGYYPKELFIHGKTNFTDEEWNGFSDAVSHSPETELVGITIKKTDGFKMYNDTKDKRGNYGALRGLAHIADAHNGYLWTKGYIPSTETANHMEVASPLKVSITRGESDMKLVLKDILGLTKLNYNACIYGDGEPVTLRFSDTIGDILTAIKDVNWPAQPFKYYI